MEVELVHWKIEHGSKQAVDLPVVENGAERICQLRDVVPVGVIVLKRDGQYIKTVAEGCDARDALLNAFNKAVSCNIRIVRSGGSIIRDGTVRMKMYFQGVNNVVSGFGEAQEDEEAFLLALLETYNKYLS